MGQVRGSLPLGLTSPNKMGAMAVPCIFYKKYERCKLRGDRKETIFLAGKESANDGGDTASPWEHYRAGCVNDYNSLNLYLSHCLCVYKKFKEKGMRTTSILDRLGIVKNEYLDQGIVGTAKEERGSI